MHGPPIGLTRRLALLLAALVATPAGPLHAQSVPPGGGASPPQQAASATPLSARGLRIDFADGTAVTRPLRPSARMWTPGFPRIPGAATASEGQPARLDVRYADEGQQLLVTVSLLYGTTTVPVATVRVAPEAPVTVDDLRAHGVEPITVSIVALTETVSFAPLAASPSAQLDVRVDPVGTTGAIYRVLLTNRSPLPLMWIGFHATRGTRGSVTGSKQGVRNQPLVPANAEASFEFTIGQGGRDIAASPVLDPVDLFEITSLFWEDGLVEGDRARAEMQGRFATGRAAQLRALLGRLRGTSAPTVDALRRAVAPSLGSNVEMEAFRDLLLADLDHLERSGRTADGADLATWLSRTIAECEAWLARIVLPRL
jgi:hypothetical protein